jgi:chitinase
LAHQAVEPLISHDAERLPGSGPARELDPSWQPVPSATLPTLTAENAAVVEGDSGTVPLTFTLTLSEPSADPVTVDYATDNVDPHTIGDFVPAEGTVTFAPGETTRPLTVLVNGDTLFETNEVVIVQLSNVTNATLDDSLVIGTMRNDDPEPSLFIDDVSKLEGDSGTTAFLFTVRLSTVSGARTNFAFATADGTATVADGDYMPTESTRLTIPIGAMSIRIEVQVAGDSTGEPDETFQLNISDPPNSTPNAVIVDGHAIGTILNDD